jgi:hypothetical protein
LARARFIDLSAHFVRGIASTLSRFRSRDLKCDREERVFVALGTTSQHG